MNIKYNEDQVNIIDKLPFVYQVITYSLIVLGLAEAVIEASRESGKTIYIYQMALIMAELYPEGDIIITRDKQNEHMRGLVPRISSDLKDSWIIEALPNLRKFKFNENEMWFSRTHENGHIQKIWFIGEKMGGLQKNKSVSPEGYFSMVLKDEAETNNDVSGVSSVESRKQLTEDKKRTFRRRDKEKYKNLELYPKTKFLYAYNPKEENGEFEDLYDQYLKVDIAKLRNLGYQLVVIPNYKNGSGIILMRNNIFNLINDKHEFQPSPESIAEAKWFEENAPEVFKMDFLGIRWEPKTAFFSHYKMTIRDKIDKQFIPISLGIDQGLTDSTGICLNANEYIIKNGKKELTQINGALDSYMISGRKLLTARESKNHIIHCASEIVNYLVSNVFSNKEWVEYYKKEMFDITTGHKDAWLLSAIENIIDDKHSQYSNLINYVQINSVTGLYNIEARIKLEQEQHKKRTNIIIPEMNKQLLAFYYKYNVDNWKSNKIEAINLIDAYFYSKFKFYTEIKTDQNIVYNTYIKGEE